MLILPLVLSGCSKGPKREVFGGADELYDKARSRMDKGDYDNSIRYFEALEARMPFSNQARQAQLDLIYAYYMNNQPESAIDAARQFERENPTHSRVDYAIYMRGLAQFAGQAGWSHRTFRVDLSKRPPVQAREAFDAFNELNRRFPDSHYAADARQRMVFLRNRLADHENHVARYYLNRGAYAAAVNRAAYSMQTFNGAPGVEESLKIMIEAYQNLGMADLASDTRRILQLSFPESTAPPEPEDSPWYKFW